MYRQVIKPFFDVFFAFFFLMLILPFLILISLALVLHFRGSPFFFQQRIGIGEKVFRIWKFRTMTDKRAPEGELLPDENRITWLGAFLRRYGIDEIPQIINILKGDMSFIGPRPLLPEYLPLYSEEIKGRHSVKAGITGLAQVNGGNSLDWEKRFEFDLKYIKNISLLTDLKIALKTCFYMVKMKTKPSIGAYKP